MKTLVINLDRDTHKWKRMENAPSMLQLERFPAIDGSLPHPNRPWYMNALMWGCLESHRKIWDIVSKEKNACLICEDDCEFLPEFGTIKTYIDTLPSDFDVAVVGYISSDIIGDNVVTSVVAPFMKRRIVRKINDMWTVPGYFIGSHCYLLSPAGAKKLCTNKETYHVDAVLSRDTNLNIYTTPLPLVIQQKTGMIPYNRYTTVEWLAIEPLIGLGEKLTIRVYHVTILCVAIIVGLSRSPNKRVRFAGIAMISLMLSHYSGTCVHNREVNRGIITDNNSSCQTRNEVFTQLNDIFSVMTAGYLIYADDAGDVSTLYMVSLVLKHVISNAVSYFSIQRDPTCDCQERALLKHSVCEYCNTLIPSGHMLPALFLTYVSPQLGIPVASIQAFLILKSKSHHVVDIMASAMLVFCILHYRFKS
jgi:GR25 family glycosyltransferase involved in LPS biosynthesis